MSEQSKITNCALYHRPGDDTAFTSPGGDVLVRLDGYLICPKEMFTQRQINSAVKKFFAKTRPYTKSDAPIIRFTDGQSENGK